MNETKVVNIRQEKCDVYIGRGPGGVVTDPPHKGCFGNPFLADIGRQKALELFAKYFYSRVETDSVFREAVLSLHGKKLGCFCKPRECHGDIIKAWLDNQALEENR